MAAPGAPARERMTGEDTFWWSLEHPQNPMVMLALLRFGQRPRRAALHALFDALVASHRRFRQRPVLIDGQCCWQDVAHVPRSRHLLRAALDPVDSADEDARLHALLSRLAGTPLDPQRPLWQLIEVPLAKGSALLVRVHHALGDGMAMLRLLLDLSGRDGALPAPRPPRAAPTPLAEVRDRLAAALQPGAPDQGPAAVAAALLADALRIATMPDETVTPLKGAPSGRRRVASSAPLASADVRRMARAFDCSSHELLMSCFSAALAGWLRARGLDPAAVQWRAQVPVNLRADADRSELGNAFGLLTLSLPLAPMNPAARAWETRHRLRELQRSRHGELTRLMFAVVGSLPQPARERCLALLAGKASAVLSCMPGPPRARSLCGRTIDELMFWVPQGAGVGLGVSIFSYGDAFKLGLMCDEALLSDPATLLDAFAAEWQRLTLIADAMRALPRS